MTGTVSAASQSTGNNAITVNQLDSDNSNTAQLNNNSLRYGESPLLEEFSFISSVLFSRTVITLMISIQLNQYILYSYTDRSYLRTIVITSAIIQRGGSQIHFSRMISTLKTCYIDCLRYSNGDRKIFLND